MTEQLTLSHDEVSELAGLYVLDALEPAEREAVDAHLASCSLEHAEFAELGGVVPALATSVEPLAAPPQLKARVLAAVQREAAAAAPGDVLVQPWMLVDPDPRAAPAAVTTGRRGWAPPAWSAWIPAVAAVLILAVVGVWGFGAQSRADLAEQRAQVLAQAITAFAAPDSATAVLAGSGNLAEASGFAAFAADGTSYLVMVGLPSAPAGSDYQAWYIADGAPRSAGILTVGPDGYGIIVDRAPVAGTEVVAYTIEPRGGSTLPTTEPFAAGEVRRPA